MWFSLLLNKYENKDMFLERFLKSQMRYPHILRTSGVTSSSYQTCIEEKVKGKVESVPCVRNCFASTPHNSLIPTRTFSAAL